jgi:hypothetical protein
MKTGLKPIQRRQSPYNPTQPRRGDLLPKTEKRRRKYYGRSKHGTLQRRWRRQLSRRAAPHDADDQDRDNLVAHTTQGHGTLSTEPPMPSPRHPTALPRSVDHRHHLPGPPPRHTTSRTRATMPHNPAARNPSCIGQTARRPRPPHQHLGPCPGLKVKTASSETASTEPTASLH